jgi:UDP-glucuronate decarboxylase
VSSSDPQWEALASCPDDFVVTGASGWLGRAALHVLGEQLGPAFDSRVHAFASSNATIEVGNRRIGLFALEDAAGLLFERPVRVLHFAALTRDAVGHVGRDAFLATNRHITDAVRQLLERADCRSLAFTSSGAVYDPDRVVAPDPQSNPYGWIKARDEAELGIACSARSIPMITARVFNVSGPYMTKPSAYALGDLVDRALAGRELEITARHRVIRSYLCVLDLARLMISASVSTSRPLVFDAAGAEPVEIGDLARRVQRAVGRPALPISRGPIAGPDDRYLGDPTVCTDLAERWNVTLAPLDEQLLRTVHGRAAALRATGDAIRV